MKKSMKTNKGKKNRMIPARPRMQIAAAYGQQVENKGPRFSANGRSLVIQHREYFDSVKGSVGFSISDPAPLNPGRYIPFTWLSDIARKFEAYTFKSLRFVYIPSCGTSSRGSVSMMVDYDAADLPPSTFVEVSQSMGSVRGPCWKGLTFTADLDYLQIGGKRRFTRHGAVPAGKDVKTYDVGNFYFATDGFADAAGYGDIFVEYAVELFVPQPAPDIGVDDSAKIASVDASVNRNSPFGAAGTAIKVGNLEVVPELSKIFFKQPGEYLLDYYVGGTGTNATVPTTAGSTCTNKSIIAPLPAADGNSARGTLAVDVKNVNEYLQLEFPAFTTVTSLYARLAPYAYALA